MRGMVDTSGEAGGMRASESCGVGVPGGCGIVVPTTVILAFNNPCRSER